MRKNQNVPKRTPVPHPAITSIKCTQLKGGTVRIIALTIHKNKRPAKTPKLTFPYINIGNITYVSVNDSNNA